MTRASTIASSASSMAAAAAGVWSGRAGKNMDTRTIRNGGATAQVVAQVLTNTSIGQRLSTLRHADPINTRYPTAADASNPKHKLNLTYKPTLESLFCLMHSGPQLLLSSSSSPLWVAHSILERRQ